MDAFLRTMEYTCTKDDLLREARRAGLGERTVQRWSLSRTATSTVRATSSSSVRAS